MNNFFSVVRNVLRCTVPYFPTNISHAIDKMKAFIPSPSDVLDKCVIGEVNDSWS